MRVLALIFITFILMGCDNFLGKNQDKKQNNQNDVIVDVIPDSILKNANIETNDTEIDVMEDVSNLGNTEIIMPNNDQKSVKNDTKTEKDIPHVSEVVSDQKMPKQQEKNTETIDMEMNPISVVEKKKTQSIQYNNEINTPVTESKIIEPKNISMPVSTHNGSLIIVGNDRIGQSVSPRKYIQQSFAVFEKNKYAVYIEFQVYAVPTSSRLRRSAYYLLGYNKFARLINHQAQFTRFWNGKNTKGQFLPKGKYNIYLYYKVKNSQGKIIQTGGRYWGNSRKYYVQLY